MKPLPVVLFAITLVFLVIMRSTLVQVLQIEAGFGLFPVMQVVLSVTVGAAALFVILSRRFTPRDKHWAYATLGTIIGFWLNSSGSTPAYGPNSGYTLSK